MRDTMLKNLARWHADHPWRMLIIVLVLSLIFMGFATQLTLTMRWSDLLPTGDKHTISFDKVVKEFVTASSIVIVVQGEEDRIKKFAETAVPRILDAKDTSKNAVNTRKINKLKEKIAKLKADEEKETKINSLESQINELRSLMNRKLVQRIDYKTEVDFMRNHGLMLMKAEDLKNMRDVFKNPNLTGLLTNINNSMEKEYVGREESISTREKEDQAFIFLDSIENWIKLMQKYAKGDTVTEEEARRSVDKLLLGEPYFLSYDKKALILNVIPNFTVFDVDLLVSGTDTVQAIVDDVLKAFPDVRAGLTGMIPLGHDEMVYAEKSINITSIIALMAILVLLIVSFRMWVAPLLAVFNLIIGTLWAVGVAAVVVGQLNIMTSMFAVILLGLGVDFSIHIISGFTEGRAAGKPIREAMEETFLKSGKGVMTGALTTACAFLTMVISSSRGMKEMGLVTGTGLLAILAATFLLLPSLLVLRERRIDRRLEKGLKAVRSVQRDISFRFLGRTAIRLSRGYVFTIVASLIVTALLVWSALNITFDQNYMNIEAKGLTSIALQDIVLDKFDLSMAYALVLVDNVEESRKIAEEYREVGTVAMTEDMSFYVPSQEQQQKRMPYLSEIRKTMDSKAIRSVIEGDEMPVLEQEIERLKLNVMEMQDMAFLGGQDKVDSKCKEIVGDPDKTDARNIIDELLDRLKEDRKTASVRLTKFQRHYAPYFKESVIKMCSNEPISMEDLPPSILDRFSNKNRSQFLVTVFPASNMWQDAEFFYRFTDDLERISDNATGFPPVFRALIDIVGRDGRNSALLTLVIVFLLLWLDYHKPRYAMIASIPLVIGVFWMLGLMHLLGMQLTVVSVMGLPMIIGIGIDDGVHIVHRWRIEGRGKIRTVFSSTGKAILLTSLTTMLAFGSMVFSVYRGFGQLGSALFIGVGVCFLTTVIVLSGIIGIIERKRK